MYKKENIPTHFYEKRTLIFFEKPTNTINLYFDIAIIS